MLPILLPLLDRTGPTVVAGLIKPDVENVSALKADPPLALLAEGSVCDGVELVVPAPATGDDGKMATTADTLLNLGEEETAVTTAPRDPDTAADWAAIETGEGDEAELRNLAIGQTVVYRAMISVVTEPIGQFVTVDAQLVIVYVVVV